MKARAARVALILFLEPAQIASTFERSFGQGHRLNPRCDISNMTEVVATRLLQEIAGMMVKNYAVQSNDRLIRTASERPDASAVVLAAPPLATAQGATKSSQRSCTHP
jgi:hypothetical protein